MKTTTRTIIGYNVYHAPEGCGLSHCGQVKDIAEAEALAATTFGLPESEWETARKARHPGGTAPEGDESTDEHETVWLSAGDGNHCAVPVYAPLLSWTLATDSETGSCEAETADQAAWLLGRHKTAAALEAEIREAGGYGHLTCTTTGERVFDVTA